MPSEQIPETLAGMPLNGDPRAHGKIAQELFAEFPTLLSELQKTVRNEIQRYAACVWQNMHNAQILSSEDMSRLEKVHSIVASTLLQIVDRLRKEN